MRSCPSWLRRPVNIGIQQPDACASLGQCHGQIDAGRAFADATLARGDRHNVFDQRQQRRGRALPAGDRGIGRHLDLDFGDPRQVGHRPARLIARARNDCEQSLAVKHDVLRGKQRLIGEDRRNIVLAWNIRRCQNRDDARSGANSF